MSSKSKYSEVLFILWAVLALASLWPVTRLLEGSFPLFTVIWIVVPLAAVIRSNDASRVGFRPVPWGELARVTAINLGVLLALMLVFEPWSHTYQKLLGLAMSGSSPDTTFAWLLRYERIPALAGMLFFSGLVTLFGEELFFRGWLLQSLLKRWGPTRANIIQAALGAIPNLLAAFALPPLQGFLYALVYAWLAIGLVGGWAASRTNSIWPSLVSATICNFVLVVLIV